MLPSPTSENPGARLLRAWAEEKSEAAFAELVRQHLDLVYSAALRRTGGNTWQAAEVAQQVFTRLARDAATLAGHTVLTAWLYTATRNAAIDLRRTEYHRRLREREAHRLQPFLSAPAHDDEWSRVRPVLDAAMDELAGEDRTAVLLRFFEKRSFADIGAALATSDDAARMRTARALEKLHGALTRRGIASTAAALSVALADQAVIAAPAGLAAHIVTGAMSTAVAVSGISAVTANVAAAISVTAAGVALAVGLWADHQQHQAAAKLAEVQNETRALRNQAQALTRAAMTANASPAADPNAGRLPPRRAQASPPAQNTAAAARAFLAQHPETVPTLRDQAFDRNWGWRLRALGLPPETRARLEEIALQGSSWDFRLQDNRWSYGPADPHNANADDEEITRRLRDALDESQRQAYDNAPWLSSARDLAKTVTAIMRDSPEPLTPAQAQGIVDQLAAHGLLKQAEPFPAGIPIVGLGFNSVDWPAARHDLSAILSPAQLAVFDAARDNLLAQRRIAVDPAGRIDFLPKL